MTADPVLEHIVMAANTITNGTDGRAEYRITITVAGATLTGTIITATEFRLHHPLLEQIDEVARLLKKDIKEIAHLRFEDVYGSGFIHLKNVIFESGRFDENTNHASRFFRTSFSNVSGFGLR